jgi:hypothetical protein
MNVTDVIDTIEYENSDFRILTADKGLQVLFSDLYAPEKVIELPRLFGSFRSVIHLLRDFIRLFSFKKKILSKCKQMAPKKIIFYYVGWNGFESWLIKKLSGSAEIYYRPKVDINFLKSSRSIKNIIKTIILSAIYGIKFKSSLYYGDIMITIDESFLKMVRAQKYDHIYDNSNVIKFIQNKYNYLSHVKVLLLVGGEYYLEKNEYCKKITDIYSILLQYYDSCEIGIKNHPGFPEVNFEWENDVTVISSKIPANLLCHGKQVVIAYGSSTLYDAAEIGVKAVSLAFIINSTSEGQDVRTSKFLLDNLKSGKISFPKNLNEFNDLLITQSEILA